MLQELSQSRGSWSWKHCTPAAGAISTITMQLSLARAIRSGSTRVFENLLRSIVLDVKGQWGKDMERLDCCLYLFVFFYCVIGPLPLHCPVRSLRAYMCSYSQNRSDHSHWANLGKALSFVQTLAEGRRVQRLWNSCYRLSPPRFGLSWAIKWAMHYLS